MKTVCIEKLNPIVSQRVSPFIDEILKGYGSEHIHSIHIVGSSITSDFDEKTSDINSVIVLNEMDLGFVKFIAPLGKKYSKKRIAAPLKPPSTPPNYVVDLAGIIRDNVEAQLNSYLRELEQKTTAQVVVLTVQSLDGEDIAGFSLRMAEKLSSSMGGRRSGW